VAGRTFGKKMVGMAEVGAPAVASIQIVDASAFAISQCTRKLRRWSVKI